MKEQGVFVANSPESNTNQSTGIAQIRRYLENGICVGLGSVVAAGTSLSMFRVMAMAIQCSKLRCVAAGTSLSMFRVMAMAIQCSKLRWRLTDQRLAPLTVSEAFYLATKGGGAFFGKVGSFEQGYEFDALVINDEEIRSPRKLTVKERIERLLYLAEDGAFFGKVGSFEQGYEFDALVINDEEIRSPRKLTVKERIERLLYLAEDRHIIAKYISGREIFSKEA